MCRTYVLVAVFRFHYCRFALFCPSNPRCYLPPTHRQPSHCHGPVLAELRDFSGDVVIIEKLALALTLTHTANQQGSEGSLRKKEKKKKITISLCTHFNLCKLLIIVHPHSREATTLQFCTRIIVIQVFYSQMKGSAQMTQIAMT